MQETNNKKVIIILLAVIAIAVIAIALYFLKPSVLNIITKPVGIDATRPIVIENEQLVIPDTQKITGTEGRFGAVVTEESVRTPLVPKSEGEMVVVPKAILTIKGSIDTARKEAEAWSLNAVPALITSLGAITLEGKSSQWQIVFVSPSKKNKGYEIIIHGDQIVSQKEIDSRASGSTLPESLKDSDIIIHDRLQSLPQYTDASISAISLYFNTDLNKWRYTLTTSRGTTSTAAE